MFELLLEKYSFTSLIAIFIATSSDSPRDDDAPLSGRRAPNVTLCFPLLLGRHYYFRILANK